MDALKILSSHGRIVIDFYKTTDGNIVWSLEVSQPSVRISGEKSLEECLKRFEEYLKCDKKSQVD
jgi:hypothetical protein